MLDQVRLEQSMPFIVTIILTSMGTAKPESHISEGALPVSASEMLPRLRATSAKKKVCRYQAPTFFGLMSQQ